MAYLTLVDIQNRITPAKLLELIRRSSIDADATNLINSAIADAESAINTYAVGTTDYPWVTVPAQAVECAFSICHAYLYLRSWPGTPMPLHIKEPYDAAKQTLKDLRDRQITWVASTEPGVNNPAKPFVSLPDDTPTYTSPRQARLSRLRKLL